MKKNITVITAILILLATTTYAQTTLKAYKVGHTFNVSLPDYMSKTLGLNSAAAFQYKNTVKDVYGFIIPDTKEDLALVDLNFASIDEFYEDFIKDFVIDAEKRKVSKPKSQKKGVINFIECDLTYYDKEVNGDIYYLIGIVQTEKAYYKVLSWTTVANKDKFKPDFQKILYSVTD